MKNKIRDLKLYLKNKLEDPLLYKYPLFVSYPRSGAHWINSIMEVYFDRPRLRKGRKTFLNRKRKDWMWIHDHDHYLKIIRSTNKKFPFKQKLLFLYRNPSDVIYSHLNVLSKNYEDYGYLFSKKFQNKNFSTSEDAVMKELKRWTRYHEEYSKDRDKIKFTYISYDRFKDPKTRNSEFEKICNHFGLPFIKERFENIFDKYGHLDLDKHKRTKKEIYADNKKEFNKKWKKTILEKTKDLRKELEKK